MKEFPKISAVAQRTNEGIDKVTNEPQSASTVLRFYNTTLMLRAEFLGKRKSRGATVDREDALVTVEGQSGAKHIYHGRTVPKGVECRNEGDKIKPSLDSEANMGTLETWSSNNRSEVIAQSQGCLCQKGDEFSVLDLRTAETGRVVDCNDKTK